MSEAPLGSVLRHLRHVTAAHSAAEASDRDLLQAFAARHDQSAFAALMSRHGPMVLGVCRHVLGSVQDAEDAFQATFLVLARKASTLRKPDTLASWLHGVARHVAQNARRAAGRRRLGEGQASAPTPQNPAWEAAWHEVQTILDEEIERLPEKYRIVFILCCLEGQGRADAARQLGLKEGTVASRLAVARERLRKRLAARGIALSAVLGATALWSPTGTAAVSVTLATSTAVAAALIATEHATLAGAASNEVAILAEGVLKAMWIQKVKIAAGLVLAVALGAGISVQFLPRGTRAAEPTQEQQALPPKTEAAGEAERPRTMILEKPVQQMRWSRDGKWMAGLDTQKLDGGARQHTFHIWDAQTGKLFRDLPGGLANCWDFSPDGQTLALGDLGSKPGRDQITPWDVEKGQRLPTLEMESAHKSGFWLAFAPDGLTLAVYGSVIEDGNVRATVRLFDVQSGIALQTYSANGSPIESVAFAPRGKRLAAGGKKGEIVIWNQRTGKVSKEWESPGAVLALAFSPDGKLLAHGGQGAAVAVRDVVSGQSREFKASLDSWVPDALAFSPDGRFLAAAGGTSKDGKPVVGIQLWNTTTGESIRTGIVSGRGMAFPPDGKHLTVLRDEHTIEFWELPKAGSGGKSLRLLLEDLKSTDRNKQIEAAEAIGRMGPAAKEAVPALRNVLDDKDVQGTAAVALWRVDRAAFTEVLTNPKDPGRWAVILALFDIGTEAKELAPLVLKIAADRTHSPDREHALWVLPAIGADPVTALPVLTAALQDARGQYARILSAQALGEYGPRAKEALPALLRALRDPDAQVRADAAGAVWRISKETKDALPALIAALGEENSAARQRAMSYLREIGPEARPAFPALLAIWNNPATSKTSKEEARAALKAIDPKAAAEAGVK